MDFRKLLPNWNILSIQKGNRRTDPNKIEPCSTSIIFHMSFQFKNRHRRPTRRRTPKQIFRLAATPDPSWAFLGTSKIWYRDALWYYWFQQHTKKELQILWYFFKLFWIFLNYFAAKRTSLKIYFSRWFYRSRFISMIKAQSRLLFLIFEYIFIIPTSGCNKCTTIKKTNLSTSKVSPNNNF